MKTKNIFALLVSVGIIIFLLYRANISEVLNVLSGTSLSLIALSPFLIAFDLGFKVYRWKLFLDAYGFKVKALDVTSSFLTALFLSYVTPGRVGEATRPYFLKRRYGISFSRVLPAVVIERIFDLVALFVFAILFFIFFSSLFSTSLQILMMIIAIFLGLLIVVIFNKRVMKWFVKAFFELFGFIVFVKKAKPKINKLLDNFYKGLAEIRSARLVPIFAITVAVWLSQSVVLLISARALGADVPFIYCVGFFAVGILVGILSMLPGSLGSLEAVITAFFMLLGYSNAQSFSIAILFRFLTFVGVIPGAIFFYRETRAILK